MTADAERARVRSPRIGRVAFAALSAAIISAPAVGSSPADHLERMVSALRSLSYEGTLVYLRDNRLEALRVLHRVEDDGRAHEQILTLNGPVRSLVRDHDQVTCELPDTLPISVRRSGIASDILRSRLIDTEAISPHYLIHPLGSARVAGRHTQVVGIIPRDDLRYGYRFYLDEESGLPLKSDLMGEDPEPIEQIMFTSLNLLPGGTHVATAGAEAHALPGAEPPPNAGPPHQAGQPPAWETSAWRFAALPDGFQVVMNDRWADTSGSMVEHIVLSDGLASVSVYVESGAEEGLAGATRMGAIHALGRRVADHQVTVVGEVPAKTIEATLDGLRYTRPDR
jgi:sigma-E factor negative regulatory protein RseB